MRPASPRRFVLVLFPLALACTCGPKEPRKTEALPGDRFGLPNDNLPRELAALPEVPVIQVEPEALPGGGDLSVVASRPREMVYGEVRPTITFNKPVVSLATIEQQASASPPATLAPAISGEWRWLGSASLEFVPAGLVPMATEFKVTLPAGLKALDGSALKEEHTFAFKTPRPELQGRDPEGGFRWLTPTPTVKVVFNQPVVGLDRHARFVLKDGSTVPVAVAAEVSLADELREQEKGRRTPRTAFEEKGFRNRQTRYELRPTAPLPPGADADLVVDAELPGKEGPLTLLVGERVDYATYGPFAIKDATACTRDREWPCPYGPIVLHTSNLADVETLRTRIKIAPEVELDWDHVEASLPPRWNHFAGDPTVALPGKYRPGTRYTITVDAGAADEFGQAAPAFAAKLRTDDLDPGFDLGAPLALVEATGDGNLPLWSANATTVEVRAWAIDPPEAARLARTLWSRNRDASGAPVDFSVSVAGPKNEPRVHPLPLRKALGDRKTGLVFVRATSPQVPDRREVVLAQLTDLAVHAKLGPRSGLAWVTSLATGQPVPGAQVTLYDEAGAARWSGATDGDGLVEVAGLAGLIPSPEYAWSTPHALVAAEKDGDVGVAWSEWDDGVSASSFGIPQAWDGEVPEAAGLVFSERGIYRPGDEVRIKGILRYRRIGQLLSPAAKSKMELVVADSRGKDVKRAPVTISKFGSFDAKVEIPAEASLGHYRVTVAGSIPGVAKEVSYQAGFRVEEYRAPQFMVDVAANADHLVAGDALEATVFARYLFGGAMERAKVRWTVNRTTTSYTPPGNANWVFGKRTWWWDDREPSDSASVFASGEGEVDARGTLALKAGAVETPGDRAHSYTVEAEVEDVNRLRLASRATVTVHPSAFYAGLKGPEGFPEAKKPVRVEAIAVNAEGKRVEGAPLHLEFVKRTWNNLRKKGVGGRYYTESEPVETVEKTCDKKSGLEPVDCEHTPTEPGSYILKAKVTDSRGRSTEASMTLYVVGEGWVSWQRNDTDRIDLLTDKAVYEVGETAKILVKSPYAEADALLTVEREGVLTRKRVHLAGSATTLPVAITEEHVPNVFVGLVIVHPRVSQGGIETGDDPNRPAVRVGYVELAVEKKSKRLAVAVAPDAPEKRPREEVTVSLSVTDHRSRPVGGAEVAVYAVDEGVLRLTGYQVPDPIAAVFPRRGISVRLGEPLIHLVRQRHYGEKGEASGGGGGGDASGGGFRTQFKTTILFAPSVITDASGKAEVKFTLPDNLTTFRIMAVAATAADRFGNGESRVVVKKPLLVLPALPRIARAGDRFEAGVVVHSHGAGSGDVAVTAEAHGLALVGDARQVVPIEQGRAREVRFAFEAKEPGRAVLRFRATKGADSDGVEHKLPIELPVGLEAVATYGDTADRRQEGLTAPKEVWPGVGGLETTLSSTVLGNFDEGMRQLVEYPYGCIEQLSSRLVPFVALRQIHGKFKVPYQGMPKDEEERLRQTNAILREFVAPVLGDTVDTTGIVDPDEVVRRSLRAIAVLQAHNGGFRYWPSATCTDPWASAYATLALGRAKDVGYEVDPDVLSRAEGYLLRVAGGWCDPCYRFCAAASDETRAFSLYTLARQGRPQPSTYDELLRRRNKLSLFGKALLADAMFVGGGNRAQAKTLLTEILNHARETPREAHFEEVHGRTYAALWHSDTRTTGLVLQTLVDIAPDHPYVAKIGNYLTRVRTGGRFRNTQEAAFSLIGLTEVVRVKEKAEPDFTARVLLGERALIEKAFKGRSTAIQRSVVPTKELLALAGKPDLPFLFTKDGPGVLYYGALLRYAPRELPLTPLERGITVQRWFEPYLGGGQATKFYAGDLVRVRLRVASAQERHYVAVEVPLPAGLEPVDTALASTARLPSEPREEGAEPGYEHESAEDVYGDEEPGDFARWATRFWSPFNHTETRDDRVVLFADHLPPGVHASSFVARATTPGDFLMKPAKAEEMYTPEVFGRSPGGRFQIDLPPPVAQK